MRIVEAPIGVRGGIDTAARLDAKHCALLKSDGVTFVVRYLSLHAPSVLDLTKGERDAILNAGLGLMVVQHVRFEGWSPTAELGAEDAAAAIHHARELELPNGSVLWCDLEGMNAASTNEDAIAYENAWSRAVLLAHYDPGVYIGAGVPLTSLELFKRFVARRYWRSQSNVPDVASRGYQMVQLFPSITMAGIPVDVNFAQSDHKGSRPTMIVL